MREQLIEAMANAVAGDRAEEVDEWHFEDARVSLDALLVFLTEHADDWKFWPYGGTIRQLIELLSADPGGGWLMESPSRILKALDVPPPPSYRGWSDQESQADLTIRDAARFLTLLYQDCGECGGSGVKQSWHHDHGTLVDEEDCPSCGGSGVVPTEEAIEIMAKAIAGQRWPDMSWYAVVESSDPEPFRADARAALMALRTIGDEG